jgi:hypothetical protein
MDKGLRKTIEEQNEGLEFDPMTHTYWYNGEKMTSVTSVLKKFFPFDANYVANAQLFERNSDGTFVTDEKGQYQRKKWVSPKYEDCEHAGHVMDKWGEKRDYGTDRHKFVEDYLMGEFVTFDDPAEVGMFRFLQKFCPDDVLCEVMVAAPQWKLAGTIDVLYKQNGHMHIADTKTDTRISKEAFKDPILGKAKCPAPLSMLDNCNYNKYMFQLGIYALILLENYDIMIKSITVWHVEPDGTMRPYPIVINDTIRELIGLVIQDHLEQPEK